MSFLPQGAGPGPSGTFNRLVAAPGQRIALGSEGGTLLLGPPGGAPGSMTLQQIQDKIWHLLREPGPYTGFAAPTTGDYSASTLQADINIALAQFIAETGIAPDLTDRQDTYSVFPVLDQPLPPGLVSLQRVEYTPAGQQTYVLRGKSFSEFDQMTGGVLPSDQGQPYYYRQPYAGYIRLSPQPNAGNAIGPGIGAFTIFGSPAAGNVITLHLTAPGIPAVTVSYTVLVSDTLSTIAFSLASLVNQSAAVQGVQPNGLTAFLAPVSAVANTITLTALLAPGTSITYYATTNVTTGVQVSPSAAAYLSPNGDSITYYYASLGIQLLNPGDVPNIPPQYHVNLVYRCLADYWDRKQDPDQAKAYMAKFKDGVKFAKSFTFDANRGTQPTIAGDLEDSYTPGWF